MLVNDLRVHGQINLSIKRATCSSSNCAHPLCSEHHEIRRVPIETRFVLMKDIRFYIPPRGLVCELHRRKFEWSSSHVTQSNHPFSHDQIEDMVDLLRFTPKRLNFDLSGR